MQNDKFILKLKKEELDAIYAALDSKIQSPPQTMQERLNISMLISVHRKFLLKWTYAQFGKKITIRLTAPEALSFWLCFNPSEFKNPSSMALFRSILDNIHRQFI